MPERVTAEPPKAREVFTEEKVGTYEDVARRNEEMRALLDARAAIISFQGAGNSTIDDARRLEDLERQIADCYERSWRER